MENKDKIQQCELNIENINLSIEEINKRLKDKSDEFLIMAQLTLLDFSLEGRAEKAKRLFETSIRANKNERNVKLYNEFLKNIERYE